MTYALGEERKTLIRGSFAQFAQQLAASNINYANPAGLRRAYYYFYDNNRDLYFNEGDEIAYLSFCSGCPSDPNNPTSPNRTESFDPEVTSEAVIGVQHSFMPELVVGGSVTSSLLRTVQPVRTWRRITSLLARPVGISPTVAVV